MAPLFLLLLVACSGAEISAGRWKTMNAREKILTVESLAGHEKAMQRKGGTGHPHTLPPARYVELIDQAYRQGSRAPVNEIWESLGDGEPGDAGSLPGTS